MDSYMLQAVVTLCTLQCIDAVDNHRSIFHEWVPPWGVLFARHRRKGVRLKLSFGNEAVITYNS